ncbi:hypothetical protein ETN89_20575 (plasmid) [Photobacterium damselae subsp. damselae]|uniref:hypothetical protein n=1 Tax=Photobacterium damselae TaxID=38293 RepID=UPI000A2FB1B5|nr:hypothetical protein [Photobacterium damselae]ARR51886.1 hypothetical protein CAY62_21030 [Photobacterium damselae subsp. damselae]QAY37629.1 hypothetical protein ETN89_20575 [Photobacterium damselae subsp. damselae]
MEAIFNMILIKIDGNNFLDKEIRLDPNGQHYKELSHLLINCAVSNQEPKAREIRVERKEYRYYESFKLMD